MRKIVHTILAIILVLAMTACGSVTQFPGNSNGTGTAGTDESAEAAASAEGETVKEDTAEENEEAEEEEDEEEEEEEEDEEEEDEDEEEDWDEEDGEKIELSGELEYWTKDSEAKKKIEDYVNDVTDKDSGNYVPVEDRIAVFDLDGTIIGELYPSYFEYMMFIHRALYDEDYTAPNDMKKFAEALEKGIETGDMPKDNERLHAKYAGQAYAGMTIDELKEYTQEFMKTKADGFKRLSRGEAFYKPMVSLVNYLTANDFQCYIVSGSDRTVVRGIIKNKLPIPENRVIGMSYTMVATDQGYTDGLDYVFSDSDEVILGGDLIIKTIKMNKVSEIALEIGKTPILSFGNSSGDVSMAQYVVNNDEYDSMAFMVLCDDLDREHGNKDKAEAMKETCLERGFETISMRDDFETIYGGEVTTEPYTYKEVEDYDEEEEEDAA